VDRLDPPTPNHSVTTQPASLEPASDRAFWLAWSQVAGVGPVLLQRLQQRFGSLEQAWFAERGDLITVNGVGEQTLQAIGEHRRKFNPVTLFEQHLQTNPLFWTPADAAYPSLLREIPDPPALLYYRGQVDLQENQGATLMVAIVGTREPTDYGKRWTRTLARALAEHGITVISGLAEGVDTCAHQGALEAGGRTIAVLGTGVDVVYPPRNQDLSQQIAEQGLILSEYPAGTRPDRSHFPRRNRIVAGLARAVLIMEAPTKSGALITAHLANDYGRDIYVLPGSLDNPKALGCLGLVNRGAQNILGVGHLLATLGAIPSLDQPVELLPSSASKSATKRSRPANSPPHQLSLVPLPELPPALQPVFEGLVNLCQQLGQDTIPLDLIVEHITSQTNLNAGEVSGALLQLELLGSVTQLPGMRYQPSH
jgi:DNA processing protein